jgi:hypothetical protein
MARRADTIWALVVGEHLADTQPLLDRLAEGGVAAFQVPGPHSVLGALSAVAPDVVIVRLSRSDALRYELIERLRADPVAGRVTTLVIAPGDEAEPLLVAGYDAVIGDHDDVGAQVRAALAARTAPAA